MIRSYIKWQQKLYIVSLDEAVEIQVWICDILEELMVSQSPPGASPLYNTKMYVVGRHVAGGGWEPTPNFDRSMHCA